MNNPISYSTELKKIKQITPEEIKNVKIHNKSHGNLVFEINKKWMFKFPKTKEYIKDFKKEISFLREFAPHSPIKLPCYKFIGKDFAGYEKIQGEDFKKEVFEQLSEAKKEKITKQLANFLDKLQQFEFEKIEDHEFDIKEFYNIILPSILVKLSKTTQKNTKTFFDKFINNPKLHEFPKKWIHADLREANMFFDKNTYLISGIIDFGDLYMGDIAYEYGKLWFVYGYDFFKRIIKNSNNNFDKNFLIRSEFHMKAQAFQIACWNNKRERFDDVKWAMQQIAIIFA